MCALVLFFIVVGHSSSDPRSKQYKSREAEAPVQFSRQAYEHSRELYVRPPENT